MVDQGISLRGPGLQVSLRARMMLVVVGIPMVLLLSFSTLIGGQYFVAFRGAHLGKADLVTRELLQILQTVAPFVATLDDASGLNALLQNMTGRDDAFAFIALVDRNGFVLEHSAAELKGRYISQLTGMPGAGEVKRVELSGIPYYTVSREMPLPGYESRNLYIIVAQEVRQVNPPLTLPIVLGLLVTLIAMTLVYFSVTNWVVQPLNRLAEGAAIVGAGDLFYKIPIAQQDEFGEVARAFNTMAGQVQSLVEALEQRVKTRTQDLERKSIQLEAVSLVSKEAAQMRNVNMVLDTAVMAISEKFNFYHTGIFILDDEKQWAILRAASSDGGRQMLARGHRLSVGQVGIVGYVTGTGKPRIAFDVGDDAVWFRNSDLPETRSEMALPLKVGAKVVGALDVQSEQPEAFTEEDISILQLMADQLAIALNNASSLELMESALAELGEVQIDYQKQGWARLTARTRTLAYEYDRVDTIPVPLLPVPPDLLEGRVSRKILEDGEAQVVMEAMRAGERVVGYLGLSDPNRKKWTDEELELISSITEQVALALDNARLFEEAQRNARQQALISSVLRVAAESESNATADQILAQIARVLAGGLDMVVGIFSFLIPDAPVVAPRAVVDPAGQNLPIFTRHFTLSEELHIFLRGLSHPELGPMTPLLSLAQDGNVSLPKENAALLDEYNFHRVLYVPISVGSMPLGFIAMIQRHGDLPLDPDMRELAQNLANQVGVIIDNLSLSEETRQRAEQFLQLYEAGVDLLAILDVDPLLNKAAEWARRILDAPSSVVFLRDQETGQYFKGQSVDDPNRLPSIQETTPSVNGLTTVIVENHETILVRDNREYTSPGNVRLVEAGLLSQIGVPLQVGEDVLGAIFVHGTEVDQFGDNDLRLMAFLATQAAAALQNALQFGQTQTALSLVEQQARYQTNISQAVALLAQDGTAALEDVLALLAQAGGVEQAYYAESFEDTSGAYWRLETGWTSPSLSPLLRGVPIPGLPMDKFPVLVQRLRDVGFAQMLLDEFSDEAQEILAPLNVQSLLALSIAVEERAPGFVAFIGVQEARLLQTDEISALQTATAALSNTLVRENLFSRVQTSLSEQAELYRASAELNAANSYQGILDVLRNYTILGQNSNNVSLNQFDRPWARTGDAPEWITVLTRWSTLPAGAVSDRYELANFPSAEEFFGFVPVIFEDVAIDSRLDERLRALYTQRFQAKSTVFVPLIAGGSRIGYLNAIYPLETTFPEEAMRRLTSLAGQAAVAVQNLSTLAAIQARARREQMIREITEQIQRAPDVQSVLQTGLRELGRRFGASRSVVQFQSPEQDVEVDAVSADAETGVES